MPHIYRLAREAGMEPQSFYYPFFQTLIMLLGMLLCLGVHLGCGASSSARCARRVTASTAVSRASVT